MVLFAILAGLLVSAQGISAAALERISLGPTFFFYEQNVGQADPAVRFLVRGVPSPTHLTADSIWLTGSVNSKVSVRFASSGATPSTRSLEVWPGTLNRFEGGSKRWFRAIPANRRVQYTDIHPGVDLILREADGSPAFTFVVRPGGDLNSLFLEASGQGYVRTWEESGGNWSVNVDLGKWLFGKPRARQASATGAEIFLEARFLFSSTQQVRFQVPAFDRSRPLYIDVDLLSGSPPPNYIPAYPGGTFAVDASKNVYFSGALDSSVRCGTTSGGDIIYCPDAFVAAVRPSGEPIFLSVLAGSLEDSVGQLGLDSTSNVIVAGNTTSADFPVTPSALQQANAGPPGPMARRYPVALGDLFLARLNARTGDLVYSTFFGGPDGDTPRSMALGPDGSVTVLASVGNRFPTTPGAWIGSSACQRCNVLVRLDATLARPLFSSFLPDVFLDATLKMAVHTDLSVYLAGSARAGAPTTPGALQPDNGGESDAYILRLAPDGSRALFASYFGGPAIDVAHSMAVDSRGDVWMYGDTWQPTPSEQAAWLIRVRSDGSQLVSSEPFPDGQIRFTQLTFDANGGLLLSGSAVSPVLATTVNEAWSAGCGSYSNDYLQWRDAEGTLRFATYLPMGYLEGVPADLAFSPVGDLYRVYRDRVERLDLHAPAKLLLACVTSAASRQNTGRVSPGQIITLIGSRLGPETGVSANPWLTDRYPTSLAGVRVLVDNIPAPLLYVQSSQINAIVPNSIAPGRSIEVAMEYEGRTSAVQVNSWSTEFSLFTADASGRGQAAALNEDGTLNSPTNPARRGSIVALYGTGAGITVPPSADGALAPSAPPGLLPKPGRQIIVPLGEVVYAGAAPGLVNGLIQINVRIREDAPPGNNSVGAFVYGESSATSYFVTVAVQ